MEIKHAHYLLPGTLVTVYVGEIVSNMLMEPQMTATAEVISELISPPEYPEHRIWVELDCGAAGKLPQLYRLEEIIGLVVRYDRLTVIVEP